MANLLDTDAGSELFSSYEAEFKLVQADLSQKLDQITELSGEPRKSAVRLAERSLEEANELVSNIVAGNKSTPFPLPSSRNVELSNFIFFSLSSLVRNQAES